MILIIIGLLIIFYIVYKKNTSIENFRGRYWYRNTDNKFNNITKRLRNLETKSTQRETKDRIDKENEEKKKKKSRAELYDENQKKKCKQDYNCVNIGTRSGLKDMVDSLNDKLDILNYNLYMDGKRERIKREDERATKKAAAEVIRNKEKLKRDGAKKSAQKLAGQTNLSEKQLEASMLSSSDQAVRAGSPLDTGQRLDTNDPNKKNNTGNNNTENRSGGNDNNRGSGSSSNSGGAQGGRGGGRGNSRTAGIKRGGGDNMGPDPYDMQGEVSVSELRQSERNNRKLDSGMDNSAYEQQQRNKIGKYEKKAEKTDKNEKGIELGGGEAGKDEVDDLKDDPPHSSEFD